MISVKSLNKKTTIFRIKEKKVIINKTQRNLKNSIKEIKNKSQTEKIKITIDRSFKKTNIKSTTNKTILISSPNSNIIKIISKI